MMAVLIVLAVLVLLLLAAGFAIAASMLGRVKRTGKAGKPINGEIRRLKDMLGDITARSEAWKKTVEHEAWTLRTDDGVEIVADMYPAGTHLWVVFAHAYKGYRTEMDKYAMYYHSWGFNCLVPDMRGHGDSGGKYVGMGYHDGRDLRQWTDLIAQRDPEARIVLHGHSMGAASVMMACGNNLPSNVCCIVEDSGYASVLKCAGEMFRAMGIPRFPLLYFTSGACRILCGYWFGQASAVRAMGKCRLPVLFIHGTDDRTVDISNLDELVSAHKGEHEVLRIPGSGHLMGVVLEEEKYFETVRAFVSRFTGKENPK